MNIGDIFLRVLADAAGFQADLVKKAESAGDAAGATLGQRMGAAVKANGAKIIGAALALAGAVAVKGILELQNVVADFRSETGATADEADRAKHAILEMAGRNIQPLAEVGAALAKVHTDMGLVGDKAEKTTELFLRFGRVTKVNAAQEVAAFDDILDAWNLTADKTLPIMDALIVSHQKYGGVIAEDEAALRDLAPTLLAANQTWEDGLALINLFKASGADVSTAITGIAHALKLVKSPEEFQRLIADIIATEDPFKRAEKAVALFGKGGAQLANVLKPGIAGLDAFSQSAAENTGALDKEVEVLDGTFGAWFQHLIKAAGTAIVGFGDQFGGLATVLATVGTGVGTFGRLVGPSLIRGLGSAWGKVASSPVVTKAVAFASGKAATVYLAGLLAGDAIGAALSKAWMATGARLLAAAGIQGVAAGTAFAAAAAAAIVAAPIAVLFVAIRIQGDINAQGDALKKQAAEFAKNASDVDLANAMKGVREQLDGIQIDTFDAKKNVTGVLDELIAESTRRASAVNTAVDTVGEHFQGVGATAKSSFGTVVSAAALMRERIAYNADRIKTVVKDLTATLLGEAQALISGYYDPIIAKDDLRVQKDQVNANKIALAKTKAGSAERHQAQLTLDQSKAALDQTRANLLAAGQLSAKEQKTWLSELQAKYKTATGDAKTDIGELIAKLKELKNVDAAGIKIVVTEQHKQEHKAGGGPVRAGVPYLVNENTSRSEMFVPEVNGRILNVPQIKEAYGSGSGSKGGDTYVTNNITNPEPRAAERDIGRVMRRLGGLGLVGTRR